MAITKDSQWDIITQIGGTADDETADVYLGADISHDNSVLTEQTKGALSASGAGIKSGGVVTAGTGLSVDISPLEGIVSSTLYGLVAIRTAASVNRASLPNSSTFTLFAGAQVVDGVNDTRETRLPFFPTDAGTSLDGATPLATITTAGGVVTAIVDLRDGGPDLRNAGSWDSATHYLANSVVVRSGIDYRALKNNLNVTPGTDDTVWKALGGGDGPQSANLVKAGPSSGSAAAPTYRALVAADIPILTAAKISDFDTQVRTSRLDQLAAPTADVSANSQKVTNVAAPTNGGDATNKTYVDNIVTNLLDLKTGTDCSANPNYPAALKGDAYVVTVAGKVGGAAGKAVGVGDVYFAFADNAGGTEASVGTSWDVLTHSLAGALLAANNLSDLANAATARGNLNAVTRGAATSAEITMATNKLLGRSTASTGAIEEITIGDGLDLSGGTLSATAGTGLRFAIFVKGVPGASERQGAYFSPDPWRLPATTDNCVAYALHGATDDVALSIRKNGTEVGTIDFDGSAPNGGFDVPSDVDFTDLTDWFEIVSAASPDATLGDVMITISGVLL